MALRFVAGATVLVAAFASPAAATHKPCPPGPTIVWPQEGASITGGTIVIAEDSELRARPRRLRLEYAAASGDPSFVRITAAAPDGMTGPHSAIWFTDGLPSGDYLLRVRGGRSLHCTPAVAVHLNAAPTATATGQLVGYQPPQQLPPSPPMITMHFDASASTDPDGQVVGTMFDFEDGTTASGPVANKTYNAFGRFPFMVTATDDHGGTHDAHYVLSIEQSPEGPTSNPSTEITTKNGCVCESMTVKKTGTIEGDAGEDPPDHFDFVLTPIPAEEKDNLGAFNSGVAGAQLDLTQAGQKLYHRFEVIADLAPESIPQMCAEGQRVQRTQTLNGHVIDKGGPGDGKPRDTKPAFSSDPRYDSDTHADDPYDAADDPKKIERGKCPYGGEKWCDDTYHGGGPATGEGRAGEDAPSKFKIYLGERRILWIDAPGATIATKELTAKPGGFSYKAKFQAKVSPGKCECTWEVVIDVDRTGKVISNTMSEPKCI